ncbi:hypothetical protein HDU98_006198 [Podochytrium sp. JEL0797]|nr:hypothetical protein HDU98_006198 [Podochytrium sp. JEL0797]
MKILADHVRKTPSITAAVVRKSDDHLSQWSNDCVTKHLRKAKAQVRKNKDWDPISARPMNVGKKRVISGESSEDENDSQLVRFRRTAPPSTPCPPTSSFPTTNTHHSGLTNTPLSSSKVQENSLFTPLDPFAYARPKIRQQGNGSNVPLHEVFRFNDDGKLQICVIFYNVENHSATFCVQPNGMSLLCSLVPQSTKAVFFTDPTQPASSPFNEALTSYFATPPPEVYKYYVHFPEAVDSNLVKRRVITQAICVPGIDTSTKYRHTVTVERPVALMLTYLVSGQEDDSVYGGWGLQ